MSDGPVSSESKARKRGRSNSPPEENSNNWDSDPAHPLHNPEAPPDSELSQNTEPVVDRSYIISCLRKLLRKF